MFEEMTVITKLEEAGRQVGITLEAVMKPS